MPETAEETAARQQPIPRKLYFTIGEVADLCGVKAHVLRYWEQEFSQLKPVKRRNRRYYRREDVLLVRQIQTLLHDEGYTIAGARQKLNSKRSSAKSASAPDNTKSTENQNPPQLNQKMIQELRTELEDVLALLS